MPAEAERLVTLVAPAIAEHDLVLIGGQAVAFWQAQLQVHLPAAARQVVASKDLDFQGRDTHAVEAAAGLLGGEAQRVYPAGEGDRLGPPRTRRFVLRPT